MVKDKQYSIALNMHYKFDGYSLLFPDGVRYTIKEAIHISAAPEKALQDIHLIKKFFDGEIITEKLAEDPGLIEWRKEEKMKRRIWKNKKCRCGNTSFFIILSGKRMGTYCEKCQTFTGWIDKQTAKKVCNMYDNYSMKIESCEQPDLFENENIKIYSENHV